MWCRILHNHVIEPVLFEGALDVMVNGNKELI